MSLMEARRLARERVAYQKSRRPESELRSMCRDLPPPRSLVGFELPEVTPEAPPTASGLSPFSLEAQILAEITEKQAQRRRVDVMAELCRRASPWRKAVRAGRPDRPPVEEVFGPALRWLNPSYLMWTEAFFLDGDLSDVEGARAFLGSIPPEQWADVEASPFGPVAPEAVAIIRGDVSLEPYHLYETYAAGGDGLTAFVGTVSDEQLEELLGYGGELGLTIMVVVMSGEDIERAVERGCKHVMLSSDPTEGKGSFSPRQLASSASDLVNALPVGKGMLVRGALSKWGEVQALPEEVVGVVSHRARGLLSEARRGR